MNPAPPPKKKTELTGEAFGKLLLLLDPDRDRAGEKYELLRLKLVQFFRARPCRAAEELSDTVLDRLAKKLIEGEEVRNPYGYSLGIARLVYLEYRRNSVEGKPADEAETEAELPGVPFVAEDEIERKARLACFNHCLRALPKKDGVLLIEYFSSEHGATSTDREAIADRLRIPISTLRIRVHRIKLKFGQCFDNCLAQGLKRLKYT